MIAAASTTPVRTPEGLELGFRVAGISERVVAMGIDLCFVGVVVLLVSLLFGALFGVAVPLLGFFFVRHGYFLWSELRGRGTTPGKRRLHLRVIRKDGGPLSIEVLLARNLTREVEFFLPLVLLMWPDALFAEHRGLVRLLASLWVLLPLAVPFVNAERMRLGDLLAGTRVVVAPPVEMLPDLADVAPDRVEPADAPRPASAAGSEFVFAEAQLGIYGERELSVLDDLLRMAKARGGRQGMRVAADRIMTKIGWTDRRRVRGREHEFLRAFYVAQRRHLEQRLLLGRRRLHKRDGEQPG